MNEQHKLVAEKNALIETVKRLNREVAKLEHFKRNLLQQLQDDCEVGPPTCPAAHPCTMYGSVVGRLCPTWRTLTSPIVGCFYS